MAVPDSDALIAGKSTLPEKDYFLGLLNRRGAIMDVYDNPPCDTLIDLPTYESEIRDIKHDYLSPVNGEMRF